jgi:hypothetical protein
MKLRILFGAIFIFLFSKNVFAWIDSGILNKCLRNLNRGDLIYVYEFDRGIYSDMTRNYFLDKSFKKVTINSINKFDGIGDFEINGNPLFACQIYTQFGPIYSNLLFSESGHIDRSDPLYRSSSQVEFIDSDGAHHKPDFIGSFILGGNEGLVSFVIIGSEIAGCYQFIDGNEKSKNFLGKIVNNRVEFGYSESGKENSIFKGTLEEDGLIGVWNLNGFNNVKINKLKNFEKNLGSYMGNKPEVINQELYIYMNDDGTYVLHFHTGVYQESDLFTIGYPDDSGNIRWNSSALKMNNCLISFSETGDADARDCQGTPGAESDLTGHYKKINLELGD